MTSIAAAMRAAWQESCSRERVFYRRKLDKSGWEVVLETKVIAECREYGDAKRLAEKHELDVRLRACATALLEHVVDRVDGMRAAHHAPGVQADARSSALYEAIHMVRQMGEENDT